MIVLKITNDSASTSSSHGSPLPIASMFTYTTILKLYLLQHFLCLKTWHFTYDYFNRLTNKMKSDIIFLFTIEVFLGEEMT